MLLLSADKILVLVIVDYAADPYVVVNSFFRMSDIQLAGVWFRNILSI